MKCHFVNLTSCAEFMAFVFGVGDFWFINTSPFRCLNKNEFEMLTNFCIVTCEEQHTEIKISDLGCRI